MPFLFINSSQPRESQMHFFSEVLKISSVTIIDGQTQAGCTVNAELSKY